MQNDVIKKVARMFSVGFVGWGIYLILQGLPLIGEISLLRIVMIIVVALFVEIMFGITPKLPLELVIDILVGCSYGFMAEKAAEVEFISTISSQFSIPAMDMLLCLMLVAFVAQLEVRSKSEKRTNHKPTPRSNG